MSEIKDTTGVLVAYRVFITISLFFLWIGVSQIHNMTSEILQKATFEECNRTEQEVDGG